MDAINAARPNVWKAASEGVTDTTERIDADGTATDPLCLRLQSLPEYESDRRGISAADMRHFHADDIKPSLVSGVAR